jgi:predicted TIM-barrel fold metal-dependent hydrolase
MLSGSDWPHINTEFGRATIYPKRLHSLAERVPDEDTRREILHVTPTRCSASFDR